jgi:hypothetical protein
LFSPGRAGRNEIQGDCGPGLELATAMFDGFGATKVDPPALPDITMPPPDQLPAIIQPGALATPADTYIVPALIADVGDAANLCSGIEPGPLGISGATN